MGVVCWSEPHTVHRKVTGSISSQDTYPDLGSIPPRGCRRQPIDVFISLYPCLPPPLKSIIKYNFLKKDKVDIQ